MQIFHRHFVISASSIVVGLPLLAIYTVMVISPEDSFSSLAGIETYIYLYSAAALIVFAYWIWLKFKNVSISFLTVFLWATVFRIIACFGDPILSDEFYRYLLDGCVFAEYGTPYGIAPTTLFLENSLSPECENLLSWVDNPDLPTIYAPVLQYLFLLSYALDPGNYDFLQIFMACADLLVILVLCRFAPPYMILLYAWSPLIVKEFAFTAHPDVIGVALLLLALFARAERRNVIACILVALACCVKIFAIFALPFFLLRQPLRCWTAAFGTILVLYAPFVIKGDTDLPMLVYYAHNWIFNPFLFITLAGVTSDQVARYICFALFLMWYAWYFSYFKQNESETEIPCLDLVFGCLILFSPVINPWYLVWVMPFAVMRPSFCVWVASYAVIMAYAPGINLPDFTWRTYQVDLNALIIEYVAISIAFMFSIHYGHLKFNRPTVKKTLDEGKSIPRINLANND